MAHEKVSNEEICTMDFEFFRAMLRLGRRSRFVRYWGEGHFISSPANQRDMMQQIFKWFDEFLMKPEKTEGSKQKAEGTKP